MARSRTTRVIVALIGVCLILILTGLLLPNSGSQRRGAAKYPLGEEQAVTDVLNMNGQVEQVVLGVSLSGKRATDDSLRHLRPLKELRRLDLSDNLITGSGLIFLQALPNLEELNLSYNSRLSAETLAHLKNLARLRVLSLAYSSMDDASLQNLKELDSVEILSLAGNSVSSHGMAYLKGLDKLRELYLSDSKVGSEGLEHIRRLPKLRLLWLSSTPITDEALIHLEGMDQLQDLNLASTNVGDDGVRHLTKLSGLKSLNLARTSITDKSLDYLAELKGLDSLSITDTKVSDTAVRKLTTALPQLRVVR